MKGLCLLVILGGCTGPTDCPSLVLPVAVPLFDVDRYPGARGGRAEAKIEKGLLIIRCRQDDIRWPPGMWDPENQSRKSRSYADYTFSVHPGLLVLMGAQLDTNMIRCSGSLGLEVVEDKVRPSKEVAKYVLEFELVIGAVGDCDKKKYRSRGIIRSRLIYYWDHWDFTDWPIGPPNTMVFGFWSQGPLLTGPDGKTIKRLERRSYEAGPWCATEFDVPAQATGWLKRHVGDEIRAYITLAHDYYAPK